MLLRNVLILAGLTMCFGCGGGGDGPRLATVPVSGTATLDGKPFGPATIQLLPSEGDATKRKGAVGQADAQGKFVVGSYETGDGAVPGVYEVKISVDLAAGMTPAVEGLTVKVGPQGEKDLRVDLKSKKGPGDLLSPKLQEGGAGVKL